MIQSNIKLQGEPSAQALASGLATLGRYGDNYMVHAAEGETFVPKEILDANPALKTQLFDQMKSMGIENPNRYVVGDALNSINPVTGQPEFFFKKIFRAVKKVFKKVLPVAAPIIGNLIAPGIGGIIASGLTTKLQGGSWADALKSAGLAYAGGAAMRGLQGGIGAYGTDQGFFGGFGEGLQSGLTEPFSAAKGLFASGSQNTLSQGIFGGLGSASGSLMSGSYFNPTTTSGAEKGFMDYLAPKYDPTGGVQNVTKDFVTISQNKSPAVLTRGAANEAEMLASAKAEEIAMGGGINAPTSNIARTSIPTQDLLNLQEGFTTPRPVALPNKVPVDNFTLDLKADPFRTGASILPTAEQNLMTSIDAELNPPTFMDKFKKFGSKIPEKLVSKEVLGPVLSAAVPAGIAYFAADDEISEEDQAAMTDPQRSAYEQYKAGRASNPNFAQTPEGQSLLRQSGIAPTRTAEQLSRSTGVSLADAQRYMNRKYGVKPLSGIQLASVNNQASPIQLGGAMPPGLMAAAGGEIKGPGSGTSDSIPAMLSDGEFVMTAQAVRNAGNGNRDLGAARMYDMMNKFERAV